MTLNNVNYYFSSTKWGNWNSNRKWNVKKSEILNNFVRTKKKITLMTVGCSEKVFIRLFFHAERFSFSLSLSISLILPFLLNLISKSIATTGVTRVTEVRLYPGALNELWAWKLRKRENRKEWKGRWKKKHFDRKRNRLLHPELNAP